MSSVYLRSLKKGLVLMAIFVCTLSNLYAQNIDEQTTRKKKIEDEIALLDKQLENATSRRLANTKELNLILSKIRIRKKIIAENEDEIRSLGHSIMVKSNEINELRRDLAVIKEQYSKLIYHTYKNRNQTTWLMYILASKNLEQGYRRWSYFRSYTNTMRERADQIRATTAKINDEIYNLSKMKQESIALRDKNNSEYGKLSKEQEIAKGAIAQISKQEKRVKAQIVQKRREVERLNREIERLLTEATSESREPNYKVTSYDRELSSNFANNRGKLPLPVKRGVITEQFGQHNHPVFKNIELPFNNGVNITTDSGAGVYAIFDGVVKQIILLPGYNQCVLIQHGSYFTFYCKLETVSVKAGEKVKIGTEIGRLVISEDGESVLHFQLWNGTDKQNPENWLSL